MNLQTFSIIFAGVLLNSAAQLMLKAGARTLGSGGHGQRQFADGRRMERRHAALDRARAGLLLRERGTVDRGADTVDVTVAYPMLSMGYVIAALLAWQLFGEPLTSGRVLGIAIILVGVVVLSRS